jgi:hypothetical protein
MDNRMKPIKGEIEMKKKKRRTQNTVPEEVPAPRWVQKRMMRNLTQATRNKVSPSRAKCAMAVLRMIGEEGKTAGVAPPNALGRR